MNVHLRDLPPDVRGRIASTIRQRRDGLGHNIAAALTGEPGLDSGGWRTYSQVLVELMAVAVEEGHIEHRGGGLPDLSRWSPSLSLRQIVHGVHSAERIVLDELALDEQLGATSEPWPLVAHSVRTATLDVIVAFVECAGRATLRDQLTTLIARHVFDLALEQEALRARRHKHGIAIIVFDIDDLSRLNRAHGYGAGDRVLERLGILARSFFRTHDWVARHGQDSIAVLLPETTLDQAATLANTFREMVRQRLVLVDHKTDALTTVTVSAAAAGTDLVHADIDAGYILAEADAAVVRAKMNGGDRVERVALLPTSVTIVGAATLLGSSARDIVRMIRSGALQAARRGRHFHIERAQLEEYKRS